MDYQVMLPPDPGLTPSDFVIIWNEMPETCSVATASLVSPSSTSSTFDPSLLDGVITLVGTVSVGIATNAIYDLIKKVLDKKGPDNGHLHKHTQMTEFKQPDGKTLIIVEIEEEQR